MLPVTMSLALFFSSAVTLQLLQIPWGSLCVLIVLLAVGPASLPAGISARQRGLHIIAAAMLFLGSTSLLPVVTGLLLAGWFVALARLQQGARAAILRHFSFTICLYLAAALLVLDQGPVLLGMTDVFHWGTRLLRHAIGRGEILGPDLLHGRFLIFSLIACLTRPVSQPRWWLLPLVQAGIVCGLLAARTWIGMTAVLTVSLITAASGIALTVPTDASTADGTNSGLRRRRRDLAWHGALLTCLAFLLAELILPQLPVRAAGSRPSILFVNDRHEIEGDERDMTLFATPRTGSLAQFEKARGRPRYDKLAHRLLPALDFDVTIRDLQDCRPEDYSRFQVVVLICLQHELPADHWQGLQDAIRTGATNLLVAGDHTDIHGVQGPFNALMAPLGISLNYDSVYPFGQWRSQLVYCRHPAHGMRSLVPVGRGGESGYSVGGSLTLDPWAARPLLVAADGFADQGTPDAPMYAGLGDSAYTPNETRGGLVLAAERPLGRGTILAFGDTAFLQNSSVAQNFAYLSSLFDYLIQPRWHRAGAILRYAALGASWILLGLVVARRAAGAAALGTAAFVICTGLATTNRSEAAAVQRLQSPITVIDNSHGEVFRYHDESQGNRVLEEILERTSDSLVVMTNAWRALPAGRVTTLVLLAPRGAFTPGEQDQLVDYVDQGGRLVVASGYYEAQPHADWLRRFDCEITPLVLGAGQQIQSTSADSPGPPRVTETWGLNLGPEWDSAVTCFDRPIIASRQFGNGRVGIVADSFACLDGALAVGRSIQPDSFHFFSDWLTDLQGSSRAAAQAP